MPHDGSVAALGALVRPGVSDLQGAVAELQNAVQRVARCMATAAAADVGEALIKIREVGIDPLEGGVRQWTAALR
jgi:hypothetical protein